VLDAQVAETPVGKPLPPEIPLFAIPVAPVVVCVIGTKTAPLHTEPFALAEDTVLSTGARDLCVVIPTAFELRVVIPIALLALPKTPVEEKLPLADALPEEDKALEAQVAPPLKSKSPTTSNKELLKTAVLRERVLNRKDVKFFIIVFF
jgi:hypothetical protein